VPNPSSSRSREALLERTFSLYWQHLPWWLALLAPVAASAGVVHVGLAGAVAALADAPAPIAAAARAIPAVAAAAWLLAGAIGAQAIALREVQTNASWPTLGRVFRRLTPRFLPTLAVSMLVIVHLLALIALGGGAAAGLAALPLTLLPRWGVSDGTARSIALLVLLPLLVAGVVPALWWFGRHAIAIPIQTLAPRSAWSALRTARQATRGRVGAVLGLVIVTQCAGNVLVLLSRMAGSLATLLVAPDRFRPIFGEGPLRSADGAIVQLGATLVATFVVLPLMLLPFSIIWSAWVAERTEGTKTEGTERTESPRRSGGTEAT
jgi:hypothetical protein